MLIGSKSGFMVASGSSLPYPVNITFDVSTNGGTMQVGWTSPTYYAGQPYGTLPTPTKDNATFDGWFLNGMQVSASDTVPASGATLIAQFTVNSVIPQTRSAPAGSIDIYFESYDIGYAVNYIIGESDNESDVSIEYNDANSESGNIEYTVTRIESINDITFNGNEYYDDEWYDLINSHLGASENEIVLAVNENNVVNSGIMYPEIVCIIGYNTEFGTLQKVTLIDIYNLTVIIEWTNENQNHGPKDGDIDVNYNDMAPNGYGEITFIVEQTDF